MNGVRFSCRLALASLALALSQCSGSSGSNRGNPGDAGTKVEAGTGGHTGTDATLDTNVTCASHTQRFVLNAIQLPLSGRDYAIDLNGDGRVDNDIGNMSAALSTNGWDLQGAMNAAIASGDALLLLDETSTDPAFLADPRCARVGLQQALPKASPDFFDAGAFTPDQAFVRGAFTGSISSPGAFDSLQPSTMTVPVQLDVKLALVELVRIHLIGAHVSFTYSNGKLTAGKLQGAIRKTDFDTSVAPQIAMALNTAALGDASSMSSQVLAVFDIGGCQATDTNFDGSPAAAGDGKIALCEFLGNAIIKNVLNPSVQMFDSSGNYHPNPANTSPDSLSLGIGFTAIPAQF